MIQLNKKNIPEWVAGLVISAVVYGALFYGNSWLTTDLTYSAEVSWIYLPAGLRLFLTLIFGLPGAIGIALASFLISYFSEFPYDLTTCIGIGLISGFAPFLARFFILTNVRLGPDLGNLSLPKLVACVLIYALLSSGLHQLWFAVRGLAEAGTVNHFLVMFIGDVAGTLLLIAVVKYGLDLLRSRKVF